jgi:hypothetical protein
MAEPKRNQRGRGFFCGRSVARSIGGPLMVEDFSYKPREFCEAEKISLPTYRKLRDLGLGPRTYNIPGTTLERITAEARHEWQQRMKQLTEERAAEIEQERKHRSEQAAILGKLAVASPKHPQAKAMRKRGRPHKTESAR